KTYFFDRSIPQLQDQGELQYGLIAQEVQEVLPAVVEEVKIPAILDEKGKVAHEGIDVLGVKYDALIPVLIAALKEQKALIGSQVSANDDLKRKLDEQAKQIAELKE